MNDPGSAWPLRWFALAGISLLAMGSIAQAENLTTPYGKKHSLGCHNCYVDLNTQQTINKINAALCINQAAGCVSTEGVSLDITYGNQGTIYVQHDDAPASGNAGSLSSILSYSPLINAIKNEGVNLSIEIKERYSSASSSTNFMRALLQLLQAQGIPAAQGQVTVSAFYGGSENRHLHLERMWQLIDSEFPGFANQFRHTLNFSQGAADNTSSLQNIIRNYADRHRINSVKFHYQSRNLYGLAMYAKARDLKISVWGMGDSSGDRMLLTAMREDFDSISNDLSQAEKINAIEVQQPLLYLNVAQQTASGANGFVEYRRKPADPVQTVAINTSNRPGFENITSLGEDRYGGSLSFTGTGGQQWLPLYDADNVAGGGYLVSAVVNFDDLNGIAEGETRAILSKSESGSFTLDIRREADGVLGIRFGVYVDGAYRYARFHETGNFSFNGSDSYFIVGAYDGNGRVRLWVNNRERAGAEDDPRFTGGVIMNEVPVVLGADPQTAPSNPRYFFRGKIQQAQVISLTDF